MQIAVVILCVLRVNALWNSYGVWPSRGHSEWSYFPSGLGREARPGDPVVWAWDTWSLSGGSGLVPAARTEKHARHHAFCPASLMYYYVVHDSVCSSWRRIDPRPTGRQPSSPYERSRQWWYELQIKKSTSFSIYIDHRIFRFRYFLLKKDYPFYSNKSFDFLGFRYNPTSIFIDISMHKIGVREMDNLPDLPPPKCYRPWVAVTNGTSDRRCDGDDQFCCRARALFFLCRYRVL